MKVEIDISDVFPNDFDISNIAASQFLFVREANELDRERIEAHHFCGHCVNGDHVATGKNVILDMRDHASWTRPVACERAVHHGEEPGMDLFLNGEQVYEGFVDHTVGPMALLEQEPSERVLHGPGHLREH